MLIFDSDASLASEYEICLKINLRIFDTLGSKVLKRTFVRVMKSCPGDPGSECFICYL